MGEATTKNTAADDTIKNVKPIVVINILTDSMAQLVAGDRDKNSNKDTENAETNAEKEEAGHIERPVEEVNLSPVSLTDHDFFEEEEIEEDDYIDFATDFLMVTLESDTDHTIEG